jgi:hypothetical protein
MPNRSFLATGLCAGVLLSAVALQAPRASYAQSTDANKKITISKATLSPTKVSGAGGSVSIRVRISVKGGSVSSATAYAKLKGTNGASANLAPSGTGIFAGTVAVPRNTSNKPQEAAIIVSVVTTKGSAKKQVGKVLVDKPGNDPNAPPAPPPI